VTERLYYRDAMLLAFDAMVVEQVGDPRHVVLDRTAFYPTSGGQPHDTGTLGGVRVVDVIDDEARIVHVLDADLAPGPVHGAVDAGRRRDHMQQHTAQHLLSALAADRLRWETTSVHFGPERSTIEFATAAVTDRQLAELQQWANDAVAGARPLAITFEDAEAAARSGLRKASGRVGQIRVVTIEGIDRSACGGTHVTRTSEIGAVLLLDTEKIRGHVRVAFVAGDRALSHAATSDAFLGTLARAAGCAVNQLDAIVPARLLEIKALRDRIGLLEGEVAAARLHAIYRAAQPGGDGIRRLTITAAADESALVRAMAQGVASLERATLVAIAAEPPTIWFATSADSGVDAGARLKPALAAVSGRGGGAPRLAQGTAPTREALDQVCVAISAG
jgi:alanyl-tRNA synthetase